MKKEYKLKGISFSDEKINEEVLYNIFAEVILKELRKDEHKALDVNENKITEEVENAMSKK